MTVTYTHHVASSKGFGCFWKLLFRWRGSIYKLVWPDLIIYMMLYGTCSVIYRTLLNEEQKRLFEKVSIHCQQFAELIPVAFVLGFYVSIVVQRWWEQYMSLPWPDALALFVSTCINGEDARSRVMRRTIMRYVNLTFVITLSMISPRVKKRFPTLDHVLDAGFLTIGEKKIFDDLNLKTSHPKYWMPLVWAGAIVTRARKEGRIRDDFAVKTLIDEISKFRGLSGGLLSYDWISIPLVYTQVVTLAVYTFFLGTIMGRQFLEAREGVNNNVDLYVPWFTFLQFFFYMGWLKVAESLVNPFGEDDDDFEVNWLIDRNLQVSYLIVDEMHEEHPELIQDRYWDEVFPQELPYTVAAEPYRRMAPQGSTFNMQVPEAEQEMYLMPLVEEDEMASDSHIKINMTNRHESRESLQSSTSGIAMKPRRSSIGNRKESVISMLINRVMHSTQDTSNRRFARLGSTSSMRRFGRNSARMQRSGSQDSSALSHHSSRSRDGLARNPSTLNRVSSTTGRVMPGKMRRDDELDGEHSPGLNSRNASRRTLVPSSRGVDSAASWGSAAWQGGRRYDREVSMDEDGSILIRIKPDKRSGDQHPSLPTTTSFSTTKFGPAVTVASVTATTATITCSATALQTSSAVVTSVPSTAVLKPPSSIMASFTAPQFFRSISQKNEPAPNEVQRDPTPTSSADTMTRIMSQELGSDDDSDSGGQGQTDPLLPPASPGEHSSAEIDDRDTLASDEPGSCQTGTVKRKRKLPPLFPLPEGSSSIVRAASIPQDTRANTSHDPLIHPTDKSRDVLTSADDHNIAQALAVSEETTNIPKMDLKSRSPQHLMTSPSLKRAQHVSPLLSSSDEGRLVESGGSFSARAQPSSPTSSTSTILSKYFSEHSATNISLSKRFSDGKEGPKSPTDSSDASLMSGVFSRKSVSLEGLQEDQEGEAHEENGDFPQPTGMSFERSVSAPVKKSDSDHESQFNVDDMPRFPSQIRIDSVVAKPPGEATDPPLFDNQLDKEEINESGIELVKNT